MVINSSYKAAIMDEEKSFLGTCEETFLVEDTKGLFVRKINNNSALHMVRDVSNDEIKTALFDINDNKVPGPDGFTSRFFKASCGTIRNDFCCVVKEFFSSGKMLGELNTTLISLVPKCNNPIKVTDYRPIACCNVVYKCISKVISNRLKMVHNGVIDPNQSAFIEGRQISDNIIFGFHKTMVNWIMVCLNYASFSICINGESHGFFKAKRSLRQGDLMSPYLFTIIMDVFTLMLRRQVSNEPKFKYHYGCKGLGILNLFANDLMLLCHGDMMSASILRRGLDEFCLSSGLRPNMAKSIIYFGNVP
ncbi:RNA-directed DNA polymerase, eukaryota, reverse transcriptase zinc-binding domain protein [Tanacetum coccineum]